MHLLLQKLGEGGDRGQPIVLTWVFLGWGIGVEGFILIFFLIFTVWLFVFCMKAQNIIILPFPFWGQHLQLVKLMEDVC